MAHEKVYGICENKCKVEVIPKESLFDLIYPVGAIYMSVNSVNPSTLFGGIWVAWGSGRVPVGVNASQTEFNAVEKTGGEKTHVLTINEIPAHQHSIINPDITSVSAGSDAIARLISGNSSKTGNEGGNQAHNNLQPYITCYMWKRTA